VASGQAAALQKGIDLKGILRLVEADLARVEELLSERSSSDVKLLAETARYIHGGGGKRIRPGLLLLSAGLCGGAGERAALLAAVVEFIHTATLLHDDIIDGAALRRGRRTVNSRWGNDVTVLLGDFLYAQSMAMALSQDNLPAMRLLADVTVRMIEGEVLEIERRGNPDVTVDDHVELIRRKTADLFSACTRIGAMLGEVGEKQERALAAYGLRLGICFQMVDDLLDFTGSEAALGKPVANDLREGQLTLPAIFLLERGGAKARGWIESVFSEGDFVRASREEIVGLARECGALDEAWRLAERYAAEARAELEPFEPSVFREALDSLPGFILARDH
jgi:octaprenyl-diphosphate synthase